MKLSHRDKVTYRFKDSFDSSLFYGIVLFEDRECRIYSLMDGSCCLDLDDIDIISVEGNIVASTVDDIRVYLRDAIKNCTFSDLNAIVKVVYPNHFLMSCGNNTAAILKFEMPYREMLPVATIMLDGEFYRVLVSQLNDGKVILENEIGECSILDKEGFVELIQNAVSCSDIDSCTEIKEN
jgi:hypothetical protein